MAFIFANLEPICSSEKTLFTMWRYQAGEDDLETVLTSGYFQDAQNEFLQGDLMLVWLGKTTRIYTITKTEEGDIRLSPMPPSSTRLDSGGVVLASA